MTTLPNSRAEAWQLRGRTALVTGASKGIGYATARELAGLGADLLLVARDEDYLEQVRVELGEDFPDARMLAFGADLTEAEERLAVFDWIADLGASPMPRTTTVRSLNRTCFPPSKCAACRTRTWRSMPMRPSSTSARSPR